MSPVLFSCLGNTLEGEACDYISLHRFDTCPKCMCDSKPRGIRNEISCPGVKHPCGAKLTIEDNFCPQCKWKVKKELFLSESKCNGLAEDGSLCLAHIMSGDRFCSKCGNSVPKAPLSHGRSIKLSPDPPFMIPDQVKTKWELSNVQIGDYLISVMLCGQVAILSFLMVIHKKYKAILSEVSEGSLVFTFLHETKETAQLMIDDRHHVRQLIEDFLKELDDSVLYDHLDLRVELVTDTGAQDETVEALGLDQLVTDIGAHDKTVEALGVDQLVMDTGVHDKTGGALVDLLVTDTEAKDKTDEALGVDQTSCEKDETEHRIPPAALCEPTHEESHGVDPVTSLESMETACTHGNLQLVQDIISTSPNSVNIPSEHGDTPLMWASLGGHYDVVKVLLSHEVDVNVKNNRGETSLILACRKSLFHKTLDRGKESRIIWLGCILAGDIHVSVEGASRDSVIYTDIVELLLSHGADESIEDDDGFTPLLLTCIFGDLRVTETLLSRGVNVNYTGILGSTALMWACIFRHDNIVDGMVQAGADVNITADLNISALHISSYFGRDNIVNTLVAHGASVDEADDHESTPLYYAALLGFPDVINLLVSHGAQTDKPDCGGFTPLMAASESGQTGSAELLLTHGADVNHQDTNDRTPLLYSALFGHTDTARLLLSHGAEPDTRDEDGVTALMYACLGGWDDVVELLLSSGADVNVTVNNGKTSLTSVCGHIQTMYDILYLFGDIDDVSIYGCFVAYRCKPHSLGLYMNQLKPVCSTRVQSSMLGFAHLTGDTDVLTSLQRVFSDQHTDTPAVTPDDGDTRHDRVLKMLLSHGADVSTTNNDGESALLIACPYEYENCATILIEHGADVNSLNMYGDTALSIASRQGDYDTVDLLLKRKADVNVRESYMQSPLIEASRAGHDTVVRKLLRHGADVTAWNSDGETALSVAMDEGHERVVEILLKHQSDPNADLSIQHPADTNIDGETLTRERDGDEKDENATSQKVRRRKGNRERQRKLRKLFRFHRGKGHNEDTLIQQSADDPGEIISRNLSLILSLNIFKQNDI